ncbi:MAG: hypothetical protein AAFY56_06165, partial [Pseudomonadota bacterium]
MRRLGTTISLFFLLLASIATASADEFLPGDISNYVFVGNRTTPDIAIIDSRRDEVVAQIALGAIADAYVLTGSGTKLIASHLDDRALTIYNLAAQHIERVVELPFPPDEIELHPAGDILAVTSPDAAALALVPLDDGGPVIHPLEGFQPSDMMFGKNGETLLVASDDHNHILVLDAASADLIEDITVSENTVALTRTPGGQVGFALHGESGKVSVLDLNNREHTATITLPGPAQQGFPTGNSLHILVPNARDRSV